MKKAHKKVLGILGLLVVAAMTCAAIMMPSSEASAATTSVTDTIVVRVVGSVPKVDIRGITNGAIYVNPSRAFSVDYENVDNVKVYLDYTDLEGTTTSEIIDEFNPDYQPGTEEYLIRLVK